MTYDPNRGPGPDDATSGYPDVDAPPPDVDAPPPDVDAPPPGVDAPAPGLGIDAPPDPGMQAPPPSSSDDLGTSYLDADSSAPTANVLSQQAAVNAESASAGASSRSTGLRWAVALGGVAIVIAATVAILALASGRPATSIAVGYMPAETVQYAEYRLDLPGDQRAKLAGFLSKFPGFDDQTIVQTKLYEVFDRILLLASNNEQSYTADIEPWFAGQIAMGSGAANPSSANGPVAMFGGDALFVVTVKDQAKATAWLTSTIGRQVTESQHSGVTVYSLGNGGFGPTFVFAVTDKVMLAGTDAAVRAAIDSKGEGKLSDDAEFKAAFGAVSRDYVVFAYTEYASLLRSMMAMGGPGSGLDSTTVDDELLSLVPAWQASSFRFEDDALVGDSAYPSIEFGFEAKNKKSTLIGWAPAGTIAYAESHDIGPAVTTFIDRFRQMPELREPFSQIDAAAGVVGGFDGALGWWGDAAVVVAKDSAGSLGGGLLIVPNDAEAAKRTFETLRSFVILGGSGAGIELRDVEHNGATITVVDFSEAMEASGATMPPGFLPEIAYTVTADVVVVGYGEAFVTSVLDAGPGPSLADDSRFTGLLKRVGEENIGLSFVDVTAIRELIEPLAKSFSPPDQWATYETEVRPYLLPLDAFISSSRIDGDVDRLSQAFTVK